MKIVCISDTHNLHHKLELPEADMLIHSGDATMRGQPHEVENFLRWMESLPYKTKIFVPGNHDFLFDSKCTNYPTLGNTMLKELAPSVVYLKDAVYTSESGMKVYGTPWVKGLEQWAFGWKSDGGREAEFKAIPDDVDILVTHGPAFGHLDQLYDMRLGDEKLAERIEQLKNLKLHVHGHIHYAYGVTPVGSPIRVNCALCTENYTISNKPIVVEL